MRHFQLKREILLLASKVAPKSKQIDNFILTREDLRGLDIVVQNEVMQEHLTALQDAYDSMQNSTACSELPSQRPKIKETGPVTLKCRNALLDWLVSKASDKGFQAAGPDQLVVAACAFLKKEVLTDQEIATRYATPARFSYAITHRQNLWSAFERLRSIPAFEQRTLTVEHLSVFYDGDSVVGGRRKHDLGGGSPQQPEPKRPLKGNASPMKGS